MFKEIFNAGGKAIKIIFFAGFILAILLIVALKGCDFSTNKYDAKNVETTVKGSIELQKMKDAKEKEAARQKTIEKSAEAAADAQKTISNNETSVELKKTLDVTSVEMKKLDMQDKQILDVNEQAKREMELELKKLELIEAQKLKNSHEEQMKQIENQKTLQKIKAQEAANKRAAAARAKQQEIDIYKAVLSD